MINILCRWGYVTLPFKNQALDIHYQQWGNPHSPAVICVPGLTRNSRDFDAIAQVLNQDYQVICPNLPGRGPSDRLENPRDYHFSTYHTLMADFLQALELREVAWLGTSLGGIVGILLAAQGSSPVRSLILNDVGAMIPKAALRKIVKYLHYSPKEFASFAEAEANTRLVYQGFGPLKDHQWRFLTVHSVEAQTGGGYVVNYDPRIAVPFGAMATLNTLEDVELWEPWQKISCPTLILHGEQSSVLTPNIIEEMVAQNPNCEVIPFPEAGHVPPLLERSQIDPVHHWLKDHFGENPNPGDNLT